MHNFDEFIDRTNTHSQKWDKYKGQDILPMWVADCDFGVAPEITQALSDRISHPVFGYTDTPNELVDTFTQRLADRYNWKVSGNQVVWIPGLVCGLHLACRATSREHDEVISPVPIYPPFMTTPGLNKRRLVKVPLKESKHRWTIDLDELDARMTPDSRLLLFCNPQNPGGAVYTRRELEQLADIVLKHNLIVCSDEIHCELILDPKCKHIPFASLSPEIAERTITLMAPSKTYNIAGLGCAAAIITNPSLLKRFATERKGMVPDVNIMGYVAALAAYQHGDDWLAEQLAYLRDNRDLLLKVSERWPELKFNPVEATYLAWFEVVDDRISNPEEFFLNAGVGLSPGKDFGAPRFMRLNFGCTRATLEEAIRRIDGALEAFRNSASD